MNASAAYAYIFELFTGNPADVLESLKQQTLTSAPLHTQITQEDLSKDLQKDAPDYASESVFRDGTVRSVRGNAANPLNLLATGNTFVTVVNADIPKFSVRNTKVRRARSGDHVVSWESFGDTKFIDHFIIYSMINGNVSIAGVHYNIPGNNAYYFYDKRCQSAIGKISYSIVPVNLMFQMSRNRVRSNTLIMA